jgi:DNA repair protein RadC
MEKDMPKWSHPGGKLIENGPESLTDEELLAVLIGSGYKGKTALEIARELLDRFHSIAGLLGKTSADIPEIKGLRKGKLDRIATPFEMTKRIFKENKWNLPNSRLIKLTLPDLSDTEILALLIGGGYKDMAAEDLAETVLDRYESIGGIMRQKLHEIAQIEGLGDVRVVRIAAALEAVHRIAKALERE